MLPNGNICIRNYDSLKNLTKIPGYKVHQIFDCLHDEVVAAGCR